MKETRFYHRALHMSLLDGKAVKAALNEQIAREPKEARETVGFPWRRAGMVAAAVLVLLATTIMAIPLHPGGGPLLAWDHYTPRRVSDGGPLRAAQHPGPGGHDRGSEAGGYGG